MQKIGYIAVDKLKANEKNPRLIKDDQFKTLCESIRKNPDYFETRPILVNPEMIIFAGHMRWKAAKEIGIKEVPVAVMDILQERQDEIMLRDNRQNGEWDYNLLVNFEEEMLSDVGFESDELVVGFGMSAAESAEIDEDRLNVLEVYPPEAPRLKERVVVHFARVEDYEAAKKGVEEKRITPEKILGLL